MAWPDLATRPHRHSNYVMVETGIVQRGLRKLCGLVQCLLTGEGVTSFRR